MHEISLAKNIIEIIVEEMPGYGMTRVESIKLAVGEMRQVVPDTLRFAFHILSKDTPLEGASLTMESIPVRARCRACEEDFCMADWAPICPGCGEANVEITSGKELDIVEFGGS